MRNFELDSNMNFPGIVFSVRGDVTGDGIIDTVSLTGIITPDSPYIQYITLVVQDGATGIFTSVPLKANSGYNPNVSLWDFNGDGIPDILIGIASGGSGGIMYYYIYSFKDFMQNLMFDFDVYNGKFKYDVVYMDNYKVKVTSRFNNQVYIIDIQNKGKEYLNEIYDRNGKLKVPVEGFVDPLSGLYPVDFDSNQVYELLGYQSIAGRYHADSLGYVLNTLKWNDQKFVLDSQVVAIFGS